MISASSADGADPSAAGSSTAKSPTVVILACVAQRRGPVDLIGAETSFPEIIRVPQSPTASRGTVGSWPLQSCSRPTARVPPEEAKQNGHYDHCYADGKDPPHIRGGHCDVADRHLAHKVAHLAHVLPEGIPPLTKRVRGFRSLARARGGQSCGKFASRGFGRIISCGPPELDAWQGSSSLQVYGGERAAAAPRPDGASRCHTPLRSAPSRDHVAGRRLRIQITAPRRWRPTR